MIDNIHLTQSERDELSANLDEQQKKFIDAYLKRGRKTVFANVLAKEKAGDVAETDIEEVASQWELQDYIDAGPGWRENPQLFCECGRALRYQYIVLNKKTQELKKFGITHFEEHVGIPPQLVKEIVKGIEMIDYERDEILLKIANHWTLADVQLATIPNEVEIPKDIQLHFDYNMPLLDRQIKRLKGIIVPFIREREQQRLQKAREEQEIYRRRKVQELAKRREIMMPNRSWNNDLELDFALQAGIMIYLEDLNEPHFLVSDLCEYLVSYHGASGEMFSSGTFKIFPQVCMFLEYLVSSGKLVFIGKKYGVDREYKLVSN